MLQGWVYCKIRCDVMFLSLCPSSSFVKTWLPQQKKCQTVFLVTLAHPGCSCIKWLYSSNVHRGSCQGRYPVCSADRQHPCALQALCQHFQTLLNKPLAHLFSCIKIPFIWFTCWKPNLPKLEALNCKISEAAVDLSVIHTHSTAVHFSLVRAPSPHLLMMSFLR